MQLPLAVGAVHEPTVSLRQEAIPSLFEVIIKAPEYQCIKNKISL
jgi:hypothetical protein